MEKIIEPHKIGRFLGVHMIWLGGPQRPFTQRMTPFHLLIIRDSLDEEYVRSM